ncbi:MULTISPECIES: 6-phospho-alpha-glucosidase [unclassified Brenneria]|uniref:6-phospho-alpha-glucosidase n=1 Tax=unclassified Brenneria TaxID=2634434 RepID=UPI0015549BF5|nr:MULTISPECIES: 6-phospho-alpha-glucosidase [unclassified Brenneria]MBJ7220975.1 6-phospho-alpha-glucosidase [Brenneria sp. L3-3C-1]MEE3642216.1 6-phospho-alpha-glucosidase [Brenneria sp. L3_3C_1]MEE3650412.1 6-phospho-alpha-glucosidase [Brenneria sp. HEZEL_4_2_4]NPD00368.1 6-phospho-alpha-glucosidase [Brenneria sp. hezel4-2-4]
MTKTYSMVIVGGGSTWTPGLLKALCKRQATFPLKRVVMFDVNAGRQAVIGDFARLLFSEEYPQLDFSYTTDVDEAFREVDFVFCQMRTGGYDMREKDEKIPLSLGVIGQETCGPGGFAYGMRSIGDMIELVQNVRSRSPDAWILNYTNPAAIVADALRVKFPHDRRILNICDQPVNLLRSYARLLGREANEFEPVYFGLNHFGWFTHLYDREGTDLLPRLKEIILNQGFKPADAEQRDRSWLDTYAVVADMMRDFPDFLPNTYLQYYLYPDYKLSKLDPNFTRANEVMAGREKRVFETCRAAVKAGTTKDASVVHNDAHGDMIVEVAESIAYNQHRIFVVIVENNGLINNLDDSAMVEVAATLGSNGPRAYGVGNIPTFYKGMIEQQFAYERLTVEAWFEGSYHKALQALTLNRLVVDAKKARKVLDALIEANKGYWPALK